MILNLTEYQFLYIMISKSQHYHELEIMKVNCCIHTHPLRILPQIYGSDQECLYSDSLFSKSAITIR